MMNPIVVNETTAVPIPEPVNPSKNKTRKLFCCVFLAFALICFVVGVIFIAIFFAIEKDILTGKPTSEKPQVKSKGCAPAAATQSPTTLTIAPIITAPIDTLEQHVALGMIKAEAFAADGTLHSINILFDEGSDTTYIREGLANSLGLKGEKLTVDILGAAGIKTEPIISQLIELRIKTKEGNFLLKSPILPTITEHPLPVIDWNQLRLKWNHLSDLPLTESGGVVDVLIGLDNAHLIVALESRVAGPHAPTASRTALGWVARGVIGKDEIFEFHSTTIDLSSSNSTVQQETTPLLTQYSRFNWSSNCDYPGKNDISIPNLNSITQCGNFCNVDTQCKFFVYHPVLKTCYLKWTGAEFNAVPDQDRQCGQKFSLYDV